MKWPALAAIVVTSGCNWLLGLDDASKVPDARGVGDDGPREVDGGNDDAAGDAAGLTMTFLSVADLHISSANPDANLNGQTSMLADGSPGAVALFRFDLTPLSTASIIAAELQITTELDPGQTCTFYEVLQSWSETEATWNDRNLLDPWSGVGASPPSRSTTAVGSVMPMVNGVEHSVTVAPSVVQGWVLSPGTNHGLAIASTDADGARFYTREAGQALAPRLVVHYSP